jgi:redox-sensitive bicupin YhaK (pirin superfamily)
VLPSRGAVVGTTEVRRALPRRARRTVGAWCFADVFGPSAPDAGGRSGLEIGPHPHIGLQTVTWLVEGAVLHHDSLGSEQVVRPGQLNLMTAGQGIAHAEEPPPGGTGTVHGAQLWIAQPEATRHGPAAFAHHAELPHLALGGVEATVLVGELAGTGAAGRSPAVVATPLLGAELALGRAGARGEVPLAAGYEHALVVLSGRIEVDGRPVDDGELAYLGTGRHAIDVQAATGPARALLLGGEPFAEPLRMWWNFVARTDDELDRATADWQDGSPRFGPVRSALARVPAPERPGGARPGRPRPDLG